MIQRWVERYGWENTRELCLFNNQPAELWIRTNTLKCTRKELLARLKAEGCLAVSGKLVPESILLKKKSGDYHFTKFPGWMVLYRMKLHN